jgi:hypothetical protein
MVRRSDVASLIGIVLSVWQAGAAGMLLGWKMPDRTKYEINMRVKNFRSI